MYLHIKEVVSRRCKVCNNYESKLSEIRATDDQSNKQVLVLCNDCMESLWIAVKKWAGEPIKP